MEEKLAESLGGFLGFFCFVLLGGGGSARGAKNTYIRLGFYISSLTFMLLVVS